MEIIPLITLKNRKIVEDITSGDVLNKIKDDSIIYLLDLDGIEKDSPNLYTYQRLSSLYELWVDFGPKDLGDVVDAFMAGATTITIRNRLCPQLSVSHIREISENRVYANIDFENINLQNIDDLFFYDSDGLVNLNNKAEIDQALKYSNYLNNLKSKNKIFTYDSNPENLSYWKRFGTEGLLVNIKKFEEFKNEL